jgi:predicted transcriptional regulator
MLTVETIGRIRREHFVKGKTIREIARDLNVSRNTVRKVLRSGETAFEYERNVQPRPKLGRWTVELDELLTSNAAKPIREQLTLIRIFELKPLCGHLDQEEVNAGEISARLVETADEADRAALFAAAQPEGKSLG